MHGLGNDFVLLDHFKVQPDIDYSELARKLCHRQFGIGADGILAVLPSQAADVRMRIFNPDGSEPEMCGNGIRCVARYVYDQGYVRHNLIRIETLAGILTLELTIDAGSKAGAAESEAGPSADNVGATAWSKAGEAKDKVTGVRVDMGEPILKPAEIPVLADGKQEQVVAETLSVEGTSFTFTAVSMGNPHCVIFVDDFENLDFYRFGPLLEHHGRFPRKTNVEFIKVEAPDELTMKVWERGAGPTLACGTGACASLVAAVLNGKSGRRATVHVPGGDLLIEWGEDNHVYMTGPAAYVFRGELLDDKLT